MHYDRFADWCNVVRDAFAEGIVLAARDISDGGVLAALAEMAIAASGRLGVKVLEDPRHFESDAAWFAETPGFVVEVLDEKIEAFFGLCERHGTWAQQIAMTTDDGRFVFHRENGALDAIAVSALREAWEAPLRDFYGSVA